MTTVATRHKKASIADRIRARAPTYGHYFHEKPSWIAMFMFARTLAGRRVERWLNSSPCREPVPAPGSILNSVEMGDVVQDLIERGIYVGFQLPIDMVRQIRDFADSTECFSRDRQDVGFLAKDVAEANRCRARDVLAGYFFEAVEQSAAIAQLREDPVILSIAGAYLGRDPIHIRTRLWWSFPATRVVDADLHAVAQEKFHFDMNGWRTLKFFFYLTPTSEKSGAHRCILGSHKHRPLKQQLTLTVGRSTEELEAVYGKDRFLTVTGDAGTGFAEDPFVFHTGSLCQDQPRLILELEYGITSVSPSYRYGRLG